MIDPPDQGSGSDMRAVDTDVGRLRSQLLETHEEIDRLKRQLTVADANTAATAEETGRLRRKLRFAEEEVRDLSIQLQELRESASWRLTRVAANNPLIGGLWRRLKRLSPVWLKQEVKSWIRTRGRVVAPTTEENIEPEQTSDPATTGRLWRTETELRSGLKGFLDRVARSQANDFVIFVAGVKFVETEGQRVTQLIRDLVQAGTPVLLFYYRWRAEYHQRVPKPHEPLFFQLPMDRFQDFEHSILGRPWPSSLRRTCVFEFPHQWALVWLESIKAAGWRTVYDVIDDWEEFQAAGGALWYQERSERSLLQRVDAVAAVSSALVERVQAMVPGLKVALVPNGVSLDSFDFPCEPAQVRRGELTAGYFGFLTPAWFDWKLVIDVAKRRPKWQFHIIGFGQPPPTRLPSNVQLLGRIPHHRLAAYARNWDVAMVPFKAGALGRSADPIKVYEYLALGVPVVATNIPHVADYPGVTVGSAAEFENLLLEAVTRGMDRSTVDAFLSDCTWLKRAHDLIGDGKATVRD